MRVLPIGSILSLLSFNSNFPKKLLQASCPVARPCASTSRVEFISGLMGVPSMLSNCHFSRICENTIFFSILFFDAALSAVVALQAKKLREINNSESVLKRFN